MRKRMFQWSSLSAWGAVLAIQLLTSGFTVAQSFTPGSDYLIGSSSTTESSFIKGPSVAQNAAGTRLVMVNPFNSVAGNTTLEDSIRVTEWTTTDGRTLTMTRSFLIGTNLASSGTAPDPGAGPYVAMNGAGTDYVIVWAGAGGVGGAIYGARVTFGSTIGTAVVLKDDFTVGTSTYAVSRPASLAMCSSGSFVLAWNATATTNGVARMETGAAQYTLSLSQVVQVPELNVSGTSWAPMVAWSNHGNSASWNAAWTGTRAGSPLPNNGIYIQRYLAGTTTAASEVNAVPNVGSGYELYTAHSLAADPVNNVGLISKVNWYSGAPNIRVFSASLPSIPSLFLTSYSPPDGQFRAFGSISFDSPTGGAYSKILVGTQRYTEGPGANWGVYSTSGGTWTYGTYIHQVIGTQDMFVDGVMNSAGNRFAFARQYAVSQQTAPLFYSAFKLRGWAP